VTSEISCLPRLLVLLVADKAGMVRTVIKEVCKDDVKLILGEMT